MIRLHSARQIQKVAGLVGSTGGSASTRTQGPAGRIPISGEAMDQFMSDATSTSSDLYIPRRSHFLCCFLGSPDQGKPAQEDLSVTTVRRLARTCYSCL